MVSGPLSTQIERPSVATGPGGGIATLARIAPVAASIRTSRPGPSETIRVSEPSPAVSAAGSVLAGCPLPVCPPAITTSPVVPTPAAAAFVELGSPGSRPVSQTAPAASAASRTTTLIAAIVRHPRVPGRDADGSGSTTAPPSVASAGAGSGTTSEILSSLEAGTGCSRPCDSAAWAAAANSPQAE